MLVIHLYTGQIHSIYEQLTKVVCYSLTGNIVRLSPVIDGLFKIEQEFRTEIILHVDDFVCKMFVLHVTYTVRRCKKIIL
jgi:hypothetical protein